MGTRRRARLHFPVALPGGTILAMRVGCGILRWHLGPRSLQGLRLGFAAFGLLHQTALKAESCSAPAFGFRTSSCCHHSPLSLPLLTVQQCWSRLHPHEVSGEVWGLPNPTWLCRGDANVSRGLPASSSGAPRLGSPRILPGLAALGTCSSEGSTRGGKHCPPPHGDTETTEPWGAAAGCSPSSLPWLDSSTVCCLDLFLTLSSFLALGVSALTPHAPLHPRNQARLDLPSPSPTYPWSLLRPFLRSPVRAASGRTPPPLPGSKAARRRGDRYRNLSRAALQQQQLRPLPPRDIELAGAGTRQAMGLPTLCVEVALG